MLRHVLRFAVCGIQDNQCQHLRLSLLVLSTLGLVCCRRGGRLDCDAGARLRRRLAIMDTVQRHPAVQLPGS